MHPPDCTAISPSNAPLSPGGLEKVLRIFSVLTMVMTVPQAYAVWAVPNVAGVSLASWSAYLVSACLWFVYGVRRRDKTIYLACIGWVLLDVAIVMGVIVNRG
jgi:uncharacterized protein with PQ loop repeat